MITGIKYYTFAGPGSGYGRAAQSYICALLDQGVDVSWHPLKWDETISYFRIFTESEVVQWRKDKEQQKGWRQELVNCFQKDIDYSHVVLQVVPEYWPQIVEKDKVNFGYTAWEADKLPAHWPELLSAVDQVLVPSQFNLGVFQQGLDEKPVSVVPHVIDQPSVEVSNASQEFRQKYGIDENTFIFYTVNTWSVRKDLDTLIRLFAKAFDSNEDVVLIIKTSSMGVRYANSNVREPVETIFQSLLAELNTSARILLIANEEMPEIELGAMHTLGDCYVSLTRGEGWGMGAAEAAAYGNPVLITGWSGVLDFLGHDYPGLINFNLMPVFDLMGYPSFDLSQKWALCDQSDVQTKMRDVYENHDSWKKMAQQHIKKLEKFSNETVGKRFKEVLGG
jgi:glycosyltransferase involved in cell wall biosynthesis